jgi:pectate lyase
VTSDYWKIQGFKFSGNESYDPANITMKTIYIFGDSADNIKIVNNQFLNAAQNGSQKAGGASIYFKTEVDNIEIAYNTWDTSYEKAILGECSDLCDNFHIHHNHFDDFTNATRASNATIEINGAVGSSSGGIVEYNWFRDNSQDGETYSDKLSGTIFRFNVLINSAGVVNRYGDDVTYNEWRNGHGDKDSRVRRTGY